MKGSKASRMGKVWRGRGDSAHFILACSTRFCIMPKCAIFEKGEGTGSRRVVRFGREIGSSSLSCGEGNRLLATVECRIEVMGRVNGH